MIFNLFKNRMRMPIRRFAPWAKMHTPFTGAKHYINNDSICYDTKPNTPYVNHIEMSGFLCSSIISYGTDNKGYLRIFRHVVYPTLRLFPNLTSSSLDYNFKGSTIYLNGMMIKETVTKFIFNGILTIHSTYNNLLIKREIFTSPSEKALVEKLSITNNSDQLAMVEIKNNDNKIITKKCYGVNSRQYEIYTAISNSSLTIESGQTTISNIFYCANNLGEKIELDIDKNITERLNLVSKCKNTLIINTPNSVINTMAQFAKIRACESIYKTKSGLMHSPGGGNYYAALWSNDQCEYINPLFAYLGYDMATEQSINCYTLYTKYISADKALITSIIAEGDGVWHGAKDRGDSAMYAYGASRFLLTHGDKNTALSLIKHVENCLAFTMSQMNENGVIASDSDELENRFHSGKANLCTSCLAYDALISASYLEQELGNVNQAKTYINFASELKENIETYFGKTVEGYDTYMYCKEESNLRSWIAMPLSVGIFNRAAATEKALFSPALSMSEGLVTRSGEKTFWDRSTLYALRGLYNAGLTDNATELLERYSTSRLLGEHIPYAIEAFPEGNQAQLSAESGLYLRIFTEGILGYRPTGFNKFIINPNLPKQWDYMDINNIVISGKQININIKRENASLNVKVSGEKTRKILDCGIEITI